MKHKVFSIPYKRAEKELFKDLCGSVFHITSFDSMLQIFQTGFIDNNKSGKFKLNWGPNSYFRNRGFISVCDLFNNIKPRKTREAALSRYRIFWQDWGPTTAFLFLKPTSYSKLITWEQWQLNKETWCESIVPYLESGYPDRIPLDEICEIWIVNITDYFIDDDE